MTHPLSELRDIILNQSVITSGKIITLDQGKATVATKFGIKEMKIANNLVRVGDTVVIENNTVIGKTAVDSVKVFVR